MVRICVSINDRLSIVFYQFYVKLFPAALNSYMQVLSAGNMLNETGHTTYSLSASQVHFT